MAGLWNFHNLMAILIDMYVKDMGVKMWNLMSGLLLQHMNLEESTAEFKTCKRA